MDALGVTPILGNAHLQEADGLMPQLNDGFGGKPLTEINYRGGCSSVAERDSLANGNGGIHRIISSLALSLSLYLYLSLYIYIYTYHIRM